MCGVGKTATFMDLKLKGGVNLPIIGVQTLVKNEVMWFLLLGGQIWLFLIRGAKSPEGNKGIPWKIKELARLMCVGGESSSLLSRTQQSEDINRVPHLVTVS